MPKNLQDVLRGAGAAGGIKGDWDVTPVVGAFSVVDSYRATYDPITKIATADWSGIVSPSAGIPNFAVVRTDMQFGAMALNDIKKLPLVVTQDMVSTSGVVQLAAMFLPSSTGTAEQAATLLYNLLTGGQPLPLGTVYTVGMNQGTGLGGASLANLATDSAPSGNQLSANSGTPGMFDMSQLNAGDTITTFMALRPETTPGDGNTLTLATAIFDSTGDLIALGEMQSTTGNPVIPSTMTLYIVLVGVSLDGVTVPAASLGIDFDAGPNTATMSQLDYLSGSLTYTQGDWDLVYNAPAEGLINLIQATFPVGTRKNDQYRARVTAPYTSGSPYGTLVTDGAIVVVDNVTSGQEAITANVDTTLLEERIVQLDVTAQLSAKDALIAEAGRRSGVAVFYVKSPDPFVPDPPEGVGTYTTFEAAYLAAIALPTYIRKVIIIDDRSMGLSQSISVRSTPDPKYYLAGNNIELTTMRAWALRSGDTRDINFTVYSPQVQVYAQLDALHLNGGAWRIFGDISTASNPNPFSLGTNPSQAVTTPNGTRRALELGDNTKVFLSPLSFNYQFWSESSAATPFTTGRNCHIEIWPDVSATSNPLATNTWGLMYMYDGYNSTPGQMPGLDGPVYIRMGEDSSFKFEIGAPSGGIAAAPFHILTPARHGTIDFGEIFAVCTHTVEAVDETAVSALIAPVSTRVTNLERITAQSPNITIITSKADLVAAAYTNGGGGYSDGGGNTVYDFEGGQTFILTTNITLEANEYIVQLGGAEPTRFIGVSTGSPVGISSLGVGGWLLCSSGSKAVFENMTVGSGSIGDRIFRANSGFANNDIRFKNVKLLGDHAATLLDWIPSGTSGGGAITYDDCRLELNTANAKTLMPSSIDNRVRFNRCYFVDNTLSSVSTAQPIFDFGGITIAASGQVIFDKCEVSTATGGGSTPRRLLSPCADSLNLPVIITNPAGIVVDTCRTTLHGTTWIGGSAVADLMSVPANFVYHDAWKPVEKINGKKVINVYTADDWPTTSGGSAIVLPGDTIFRIHGFIEVPGVRTFMSPGTEIEGNGKTILDTQLRFGVAGHTPAVGNDGYLISTGDNFALRNLVIVDYAASSGRGGITIHPYSANAGAGAPAHWRHGKPIVIDDVVFAFYIPSLYTDNAPIRVRPSIGSSYVPDIELGNVFTDDQPTYTIDIDDIAGVNMVGTLTIRNRKGALPDTPYKRPQVVFGDKYWLGNVIVRDNDLVEPPITISATGVAALTGTNKVVAFNNRGVTSAGIYNNAVATYVDGILISDATLMLAQGNLFGAPNSP